ncbi:OmpA family protein [Pseudomonas sp. S75]|uniref:OmpA family protein n=1 Tax=unclassified Pseudomonas TaxID=196821 RepID=UPI001DD47D32|nr:MULTISPECIES: OmpA family protein [unclassified Pseudomonas]MBJ9976658.1 OmpA family protein [Pseudomonas sp. S30]MBK0153660.1 OmpA family protein [Pseudomonas sp. S75]
MKKTLSTALAVTIGLCVTISWLPEATADVAPTATKNPAPFEAARLPVSSVALGAFPYLSLPDGYTTGSTPEVIDFDEIPFWTGDRLQPVEGRAWSANITAAEGRTFSQLELTRNIEALVRAMDGQKIFDGRFDQTTLQALDTWPREFTQRYNSGLGDVWNNPAQVFVVHRADRDIWIHLCSYAYGAGLLIAESKPLDITARLLPAEQLKAQMDANGKVSLNVNFATDQTQILPTSRPQLDQVVQWLQAEPSLHLQIDGYTDDQGDAAHNQALSEGRAGAVMALLVTQGIEPGRLSSAGLGAANPVADNGSPAGRAQNRRVELVRRAP